MTPERTMDCEAFAAHVLQHIDGELPGELARAASAHESACVPCAERAAVERAFEVRLGAALAADADADVAVACAGRAVLEGDRPRSERDGAARGSVPGPGRGAGRIVRPAAWLRRGAVAAAAAFVLIQGAWFLCIPPFECAYLQAVEAVAHSPDAEPVSAGRPRSPKLAALAPPAAMADFALADGPFFAPLGLRAAPEALRARYVRGSESFTAVWSDPDGHEPSFRRRVERAGRTWWIAAEDGRVIVAWMCPQTHTLCSLVGSLPEERLLEVAETLRPTAH